MGKSSKVKESSKSIKHTKEVKDSKKESKEDKSLYEQRLPFVTPFSTPLADKKLNKKLLKLIKKSSKAKDCKRGIKEVIKAVKHNNKGLVVLAGDVFPYDVISHLPVFLEDHNIPYVFIPSKSDLGNACNTKRATSTLFIVPGSNKKGKSDEYKEEYEEVMKLVKTLKICILIINKHY